MNNYCVYYQAYVLPERCWYFSSILRSHEHMAFDRTLDVEHSIFEFFVPSDHEADFCAVLDYFVRIGIVRDVQKRPNRLAGDVPCF